MTWKFLSRAVKCYGMEWNKNENDPISSVIQEISIGIFKCYCFNNPNFNFYWIIICDDRWRLKIDFLEIYDLQL